MKHTLIFLFCFSFFATFSQNYPQKPKLIVHIVVEQMKYEYLQKYSIHFLDKGFSRMQVKGASCINTFIDYAYPESATAYATISTGATPALHGIIGNTWYNRTTKAKDYAVYDKNYSCVGCIMANKYMVSPHKMYSSTFSEELLKTNNGKSKSYSISLKPHAAILMAGKKASGVYWLDDVSGDWVSCNYYIQQTPNWVEQFNKKKYSELYSNERWITYFPIEKYIKSSEDVTPYEIGIQNQVAFPYELSKLRDSYKKYDILYKTPYGNSISLDFAIELIDKEKLGTDSYTDYLAVSLTATEEIGNKFGSYSKEVEDAYVRLNYNLQSFIEYLEKNIGKENFVIVLQSTYGVEEPSKAEQKTESNVFKQVESLYILDKYLDATYGEAEWVIHYQGQQIYLNHAVIEQKKLTVEFIQQVSATFLMQLAGIHSVITAQDLLKFNFNNEFKKQLDNSYCQSRSGDLMYILIPGWYQQTTDVVGQHLTPYTSVTQIPLIWYGWKIKPNMITTRVSGFDIIPTLCEIAGVQRPNMAYGNVIKEVFE